MCPCPVRDAIPKGLAPGGVVCLKDNFYAAEPQDDGRIEGFLVDREDSSVTRSFEYLAVLFRLSGLRMVLKEQETRFPEELFPVWMLAFEPCGVVGAGGGVSGSRTQDRQGHSLATGSSLANGTPSTTPTTATATPTSTSATSVPAPAPAPTPTPAE